MAHIRTAAMWLYVLGGSLLFGATIYQMIVVVPAFAHDLPNSMIAFNETAVKTTAFWTSPIGPITGVAGLIAILTNRQTPAFRWILVSVALALLAEAVTFIWVFPMLRGMGIIASETKPVADAALAVPRVLLFRSDR